MYVRILGHHEILNALHLAWEVYAQDILPKRTHEQIEEFQKFIKYENIMPKIQTGELKFFGAFDADKLCGAGAIDKQGHISLLYIKKEMQGLGIEQMIVQAMQESLYDNMDMEINQEKSKKKRKKIWIIIAVIAVVLTLVIGLLGFIVYKVVRFGTDNSIIREFQIPYEEDIYGRDFEDGFGEDRETDESEGGIEAISEYIEEHTGYELTEESYVLNPEDTETKRTMIAFEVLYPQISGLKDTSVQEKVNEELKNAAMETAENIYLTPTEEIKEIVLGEQNPVLSSYVEYKVTYLSKDIISVVYQDYYYEGSQNNYHLGLRTRNINLNDGTVYEVKDIVKLNDRFIKEWAEEMRDEADTKNLMKELNEKEMKDVLSGNDLNGVYFDNFFLDAEGIEIGLGFKYSAEDENNIGFSWVTAPYDWEDIREYKTNSNFWELVK